MSMLETTSNCSDRLFHFKVTYYPPPPSDTLNSDVVTFVKITRRRADSFGRIIPERNDLNETTDSLSEQRSYQCGGIKKTKLTPQYGEISTSDSTIWQTWKHTFHIDHAPFPSIACSLSFAATKDVDSITTRHADGNSTQVTKRMKAGDWDTQWLPTPTSPHRENAWGMNMQLSTAMVDWMGAQHMIPFHLHYFNSPVQH